MMGQADADTSFSFGNNDFTEVAYTGLEPEFPSINSRGALTLPQPHTHIKFISLNFFYRYRCKLVVHFCLNILFDALDLSLIKYQLNDDGPVCHHLDV